MTAPWQRATWVWMLITLFAALITYARDAWFAAQLGDGAALSAALMAQCGVIFAAPLLLPRGEFARGRALGIGVFWLSLTLAFELALAFAFTTDAASAMTAWIAHFRGVESIPLACLAVAPYAVTKLRGRT